MEDIWPPINKRDRRLQKLINKNLIFAKDIYPVIQKDEQIRFNQKKTKNNPTAFVILTRFTERKEFRFTFTKDNQEVTVSDFPDVISSVEKINKYYPNNQIIVVDADSPNKSYQEKVKEIDPTIIIENIKNKNYEPKGIIYTFKKYRHYFKSFLFLQDSILLSDSIIEDIDRAESGYWYSLQFGNCGWCHRSFIDEKTKKWVTEETNPFNIRDTCIFKDGKDKPIYVGPNQSLSIDRDIINSYNLAFHIAYCNSFLITRESFEKVLSTNIMNICPLPIDKIGSCTWERIWSVAFYQAGLRPKFFKNSEIIHWFGDCAGDRGANHTTKFTKFYLGRQ
ncbi:MAG: hypothetical protein EBU90_13025 [Proteobacteria bacterium]|nr:hypothetical protein [Pseudomonadota bacterium]NBP15485.1 hypothetical protein [bacterium]